MTRKDIPYLLPHRDCTGVELGVAKGEHLLQLFDSGVFDVLYGIDQYARNAAAVGGSCMSPW